MRSIQVAMLAFALSLPLPCAAQSGAAQDTTQPAPKKGGGLFGKVKGLAHNKVVQQVAKTAACNMVPGGQLIAGAIDNASAKNAAKNAATGAAKDAVEGAALGAASGKSNTCGMGIMGNLGAAGLTKGGPGVGIPGMPTTSMPGVGMSADQMKQMQAQYQKMGMNPAQIKAMQQQMQMAAAARPTTATPGPGISAEQMKQMEEQYRKMGVDPAQIKAMQQMMAGMSQAGGTEGPPSPAVQPSPAAPGSDAPGPSSSTPALSKEKGRLVLRQLPWTAGSEAVVPGSEPVFAQALRDLVATMVNGTQRYRIEVRVEDQGSKAKSRQLSQKRGVVVVEALVREGMPRTRLVPADGGSDKDPRLVISETK